MVWQSLSGLSYFREYPNKSLIIEVHLNSPPFGVALLFVFSVFIAALSVSCENPSLSPAFFF